MYFLKTKGTNKIPDFVQIRDNNFALILHVNFKRQSGKLSELNLQTESNIIINRMNLVEYGVLQKFE